jgi:hypothetical protein
MKRFLALVLLAGCSPTTFAFTPASPRGISAKPHDCPVEIVTSTPERNYEEIGTLDFYNGPEPKNVDDFKKAVAKQVCQAGGDAAIAIANDKGRYTKGSVIRYLGDMATPLKPPKTEPVIQQSDTEKPPSM